MEVDPPEKESLPYISLIPNTIQDFNINSSKSNCLIYSTFNFTFYEAKNDTLGNYWDSISVTLGTERGSNHESRENL